MLSLFARYRMDTAVNVPLGLGRELLLVTKRFRDSWIAMTSFFNVLERDTETCTFSYYVDLVK